MEVHTDVFHEENIMLQSQLEVKQNLPDNAEYIKMDTNILQDEIFKLKSQSEDKQKGLEESEDVKVLTNLQEECSELKARLQNQVEYLEEFKRHTNMLKEENFKLSTQLKERHKILKGVEGMKVHTNILQEENSELKSQLELTQDQLRVSETEKKHYINKYSELKDKERCDIAIQTDMVCIRSVSS